MDQRGSEVWCRGRHAQFDHSLIRAVASAVFQFPFRPQLDGANAILVSGKGLYEAIEYRPCEHHQVVRCVVRRREHRCGTSRCNQGQQQSHSAHVDAIVEHRRCWRAIREKKRGLAKEDGL